MNFYLRNTQGNSLGLTLLKISELVHMLTTSTEYTHCGARSVVGLLIHNYVELSLCNPFVYRGHGDLNDGRHHR
jgi:hypothetical protein